MGDKQSRLARDTVLNLTIIDTTITEIKSREGIVSSQMALINGESKVVACKYHTIYTHATKRARRATQSMPRPNRYQNC